MDHNRSSDINHNKRGWNVQQAGDLQGGSTSEGHGRENKRSRMQAEAAVQPPPTQLHFLPDAPQLSTSIGRPSDLTADSNLSLHHIMSTIDTLARAAAAANNPDSTIVDSPVDAGAGEIMISCASAGTEHLGPASMNQTPDTSPPATNSANAELQRQLVLTWDSKRVKMLEQQGLVLKKGPFAASEKERINEAIKNYLFLTPDHLTDLIFKGKKGKGSFFWSKIASTVPGRTLQSVYRHLQRDRDPQAGQGAWMNAEDVLLRNAVDEFGHRWAEVSRSVGRSEQDCRDRYLNHIASSHIHGKWTQEEQDQLKQAVEELSAQQGKSIGCDGFWLEVSEAMGGKRSRKQCYKKWEDSLSKIVENNGQKQRWNKLDAYVLVHKVASLDVSDESEIHWQSLQDMDGRIWSGSSLRKRWNHLRDTVEDCDNKTHKEIVQALTAKYQNRPVMNERASRNAHHANIPDPSSAEAGSSNGPGTLAQADADGS